MIYYRRLTEEDYDDIVDISKDIWEGNDYLPTVFHKWVNSKGYFLGAVDSETEKVIGVGKYSILYDKSGWLEGLRVHKDYRGLKIARGISEELINIAKKELSEGIIKLIAFSTHISNTESMSMMKKLNFKLKQEYIIVEGPEEINEGLTLKTEPWELTFEEFKNLNYFKDRENIIPLAFVFEEPTIELFNELKEAGSFITINGHNGILKIKGEPHFVAAEDNFEAINVFMTYAQITAKKKNLSSPFTSIRSSDVELMKKLEAHGYISWNNWEPDYFYYILE